MTEVSGHPPVGSPSRRWGDLGTRTASAVVLVILALFTTQRGGTPFVLFWLLAALAVMWEWQRLIGGAHLVWRCVGGGVMLAAIAVSVGWTDPAVCVALLCAGGAFAGAVVGEGKRAWAASGAIYAGLLLIAVASLRDSFPFGARAIVWLFATVWATDCFAYFGGRLIGGAKLWPRISPSKTWSGTLTGIALGGIIGTVVALRGLPAPWAVGPVLTLSLAAAVLSQAGDALESGIKRHFGVKDSSWLIPGHGGVMDRLDGFVAAAVFALVVGMVRNVPSLADGLFYWT